MGVEKTGLLSNCWKFTSNKLLFFKNGKQGLFKDNYMPFFIDQETASLAKKALPEEMTLALAVRHRYFNKALSRNIKADRGTKQIIMLGAGYDTRSVRKSKYTKEYGVSFFEVDFTEVLKAKKEIYAAHQIDKNAVYIEGNYLDSNFMEVLQKQGVRFDLPTHILWEGNTMYLPKRQIAALLTKLHQQFTSSLLISFDYFHDSIINKNTMIADSDKMVEDFDKMNAKMITGYPNLAAMLKDIPTFEVIDDVTISVIAKAYNIENTFPPTASLYSVCTLRK